MTSKRRVMAKRRRNLSAALGEEQYSELVACRRNPRNVWWLLSLFACHSEAEPKNLSANSRSFTELVLRLFA